ncbi:MAG TPA: MarR family winged helix-turn-helix transcriptional regulator [Rhizomicrobium sp.]|jgi:DNA-binding MarR family transcriptional regulator|nr:MarR family winged helix-turn-helix transcriptional regulator [Rhizomicrobium sp.]
MAAHKKSSSGGAKPSAPSLSAAKGAVVESGSELADLADLLVAANKIGSALQSAAAQDESKITAADWLLLRTLDRDGPLPMSKAAAKIGVTRQRVHQQCRPLQEIGAISQTTSEDGKLRTLSITPQGGALIRRLDDTFRGVLSAIEGGLPTAPIFYAKRSAGRIAKLLTPKRAPHSQEPSAAAH